MVELYLKKIREDDWKIEKVPTLWRAKVQTELDKSVN